MVQAFQAVNTPDQLHGYLDRLAERRTAGEVQD